MINFGKIIVIEVIATFSFKGTFRNNKTNQRYKLPNVTKPGGLLSTQKFLSFVRAKFLLTNSESDSIVVYGFDSER